MNERISSILDHYRKKIREISDGIHQHPEIGLEEKEAVSRQLAALREWGFQVETPVGGLDTAFKARFGDGDPVFCFMSEYDALPGIGHACGHNLIAASALAAGLATAKILEKDKIPGTVIVMGTDWKIFV